MQTLLSKILTLLDSNHANWYRVRECSLLSTHYLVYLNA